MVVVWSTTVAGAEGVGYLRKHCYSSTYKGNLERETEDEGE